LSVLTYLSKGIQRHFKLYPHILVDFSFSFIQNDIRCLPYRLLLTVKSPLDVLDGDALAAAELESGVASPDGALAVGAGDTAHRDTGEGRAAEGSAHVKDI
jgi:hypothetical protein